MKLPAELGHTDDRLFGMKDVEAIVRDCANEILKHDMPHGPANALLNILASRILARYDLKP